MHTIKVKLSNYWDNHKYSDIGKKLTSKNIWNIPWLSNWGPNKDENLEKEA